ncbi:hypothetical protein GGF43_005615 [Coemansia sp. RSA 2618]|nr:hypothetical protein GGF43_005615 [Coemansia sp. RSA 2618]
MVANEAKKARTELAEMSTRYTLQEAKLASQRSKLLESRTSIIERKKIITDLRSKEMGLEKTIAEKSLQSEEQRQRIANLSSELAEQRRVVASLGDVHTTNEQLARSLKRERTKAETQATLNANLASRVAELEKENGWLRKSTSDEPCTLTRPFQPRVSASRQAPVDDLPIVSLISDASIETHLDDDDDNDDDEPPHSTVAPLANRWTSSKPQRRPGPTFGISLKALEPSASQRADTYVGVTNPFAIANKPFESLASKDFVFTQGLAPPKPSLHSTQRSAGPLWRSKHAIASNGLGGSRQGSSIHKKGTATIQSTIGWGSKK